MNLTIGANSTLTLVNFASMISLRLFLFLIISLICNRSHQLLGYTTNVDYQGRRGFELSQLLMYVSSSPLLDSSLLPLFFLRFSSSLSNLLDNPGQSFSFSLPSGTGRIHVHSSYVYFIGNSRRCIQRGKINES